MGSMNKGYAFGFLIVLLVLVLGFYVAYTGFVASRETLRAQPTSVPSTRVVQALPSSINLTPVVTATLVVTATSTPQITSTQTVTPPVVATELPPPTSPPAAMPTELPSILPTDTPASVAQPPTPVPAPAQQFRLAGPPAPDSAYPICCYIYGTVRDAAGNPLEGVQVQAFNEWNTLPPAATKGGAEAGQYNIPIGADVVTWYVVVLDAAGNPFSSQAPVTFDPAVASGYRVDWQRTY